MCVYKIFGDLCFSIEAADAPSMVDWSGLYTQLSPEHSMRYLTKKWDDGAKLGCLVNLKLKKFPPKFDQFHPDEQKEASENSAKKHLNETKQ